MVDLIPVLALEGDGGAGLAAVVTALGGVVVSLTTVWFNSKKQAAATGENSGQISSMTDQIGHMAVQIGELKNENTELKVHIDSLKTDLADCLKKTKTKKSSKKKKEKK